MCQIDIDELFRRFAILDEELKQLRKEVGEMKPKTYIPQWEEHLHIGKEAAPPGHGQAYVGVMDSITFDEEFK